MLSSTERVAFESGCTEGVAQMCARGVDGVWKVDDLDADPGEVTFQVVALGSAPPIVAFEDSMEADGAPGIHLVGVVSSWTSLTYTMCLTIASRSATGMNGSLPLAAKHISSKQRRRREHRTVREHA